MIQQLVAAGFVLFCSMLPLKATGANFDQLYVFGDSLSDTGNTFSVSGGLGNPTKAIPPYPPYFRGRFSNNKVWVDYLGDRLGLTPTLFTAIQSTTTIPKQGINFAFGGANSGIGNAVVPDAHLPGVLEQVGLFTQRLQANKQKADPKALYAVWGGANDYLFANSTNVNQTVKNILDSVTLLTQAGAKNILVFNLPDIGKSPFAYPKGISGQLTNVSASHNSALASALNQFSSSNPSVNIIRVDINSLFNQVIASPVNFGFKNTTTSCVTGNFENIKSVCNHPNDFLFFDAVHPTTGAHRLVADAALSAINANSVPKPSTTLFHTSMDK
ncbi:MAG: SGNH/GDSL hydrolase family protein [Rhizonema sp. PD38]|nr:SGNH/GDSL hydrolase family protein [Rhizonema sp. PD38]